MQVEPSASTTDHDDVLLDRQDFQVRLASGQGRVRSNVSMLIERLYAWKGLSVKAPQWSRPNELTLTVSRGPVLFGTLTIGLDSPTGLLADELYRDTIDEYRAAGARVWEITRLAIDPCHNSKEILAAIFNLAYIFGRFIHGMTDVFIEVNPRHVPFYKRMLRFDAIGEERFCQRVEAPARLLHLSMDLMDQLVAEFGGREASADRSLYPQFFAPDEQRGIVARLRRHNLAGQNF
jgi:hypothetical protein